MDMIKLIVSFLVALLSIWFKDFYDKRQERKYKNEHLWRGIKDQFEDCSKGIQALEKTETCLNKNEICFFALDIPQTLTDYSKRLSELEFKSSYIYSDYASKAEIIRNGHKTLQAMLSQAVFQDLKNNVNSESIKGAIKSQINALKGDFIVLAEAEIVMMKCIKKNYPKKDNQDIDYMEKTLNKIKKDNPH